MDLIDRIDRWAEVCPERAAHRSGERALSYGELRRNSDALAAHLRKVLPDDASPVAIRGEKEPEMMVGFLGAIKAGHPYVPLDASVPAERMARMVAKAGVKLVLEAEEIARIGAQAQAEGDAAARRELTAETPVYIIFTSGSTGEPKGVQITAGNLTAFTDWLLAEQKFTEQGEVFLNQAPFTFDLSVMDLYGALLTGGTLFSLSAALIAERRTLHAALADSGITVWVSTPSFARMCLFDPGFKAENLPRLRKLLFCGETLPGRVAADLLGRFPEAELWNTYGPTEATVAMTSVRIDPGVLARGEPLPVGRPMPGVEVLIREETGRDAAPGETGEIVIAGPDVSPGYVGQPELTAAAFLTMGGQRAYRTGDTGRMVAGMLFCDGRMDEQVKIRGFRVELGEIASVLREHAEVREALAVTRDAGTGESEIVAYAVSERPARELREHLARHLPAYMLPAHVIALEALPLTANGKLDRKRLPEPQAVRGASHFTITAPVDPTQMRLVEMWERILGVSPIGIHDDFFVMGGHSLRAAEFMAQVETNFGRDVPLAELFKAPTIEQFSKVLAGIEPNEDWPMIEEIRGTGGRPPFYCVPGFLDLTRHLGPDQPCYGVHLSALENMPENGTAVADLAAKCVEEIRAIQPAGPYYIGGHSFGGVVAFEIAQQLRSAGQKVAKLILIDPDPPRPLPTKSLGFHWNRYVFQLRQIMNLPGRDRVAYVKQRLRIAGARLTEKAKRRTGRNGTPAAGDRFDKAARNYWAEPYDSPVLMILAGDTHLRARPAHDPRLGWLALAVRGLEIRDLPGDHYTLIREPNVARLAECLTEALTPERRPAIPF